MRPPAPARAVRPDAVTGAAGGGAAMTKAGGGRRRARDADVTSIAPAAAVPAAEPGLTAPPAARSLLLAPGPGGESVAARGGVCCRACLAGASPACSGRPSSGAMSLPACAEGCRAKAWLFKTARAACERRCLSPRLLCRPGPARAA